MRLFTLITPTISLPSKMRTTSGVFRRLRNYSATDISVGPAEGLGRVGIGANILHEFAGKIGDRGEDAARNDVAFNFGKPDLDLIQPR
jgi:hypothetical protein